MGSAATAAKLPTARITGNKPYNFIGPQRTHLRQNSASAGLVCRIRNDSKKGMLDVIVVCSVYGKPWTVAKVLARCVQDLPTSMSEIPDSQGGSLQQKHRVHESNRAFINLHLIDYHETLLKLALNLTLKGFLQFLESLFQTLKLKPRYSFWV